MFTDYFRYQTSLAKKDDHFRCFENCNAPGCTMTDVFVEVSLFDLYRISLNLNTTVSKIFFHYCYIGLQNYELNVNYKRLMIKLKKPCHFIEKNFCRIHHYKPLDCILFPEYYQIKGELVKLSNKTVFSQFPCLKNKINISSERRCAIKQLRKMSLKEKSLSNIFLFGLPSFIVDDRPMIRELKKRKDKKCPVLQSDYERLLYEKLDSTGFFNNIRKKLDKFDRPSGIVPLFEKLKDDSTDQNLLEEMVKPKIVHRFKKGKIKRLQRSLQPPEVIFI